MWRFLILTALSVTTLTQAQAGFKATVSLQPVYTIDASGTYARVTAPGAPLDALFCPAIEAKAHYQLAGGSDEVKVALRQVLIGAGTTLDMTVARDQTEQLRRTHPEAMLTAIGGDPAQCNEVGLHALAELTQLPARQKLTTNAHYPRSINVSVQAQSLALLVTEVNPGPWVIRNINIYADASASQVAQRVDYRGKPQGPPVYTEFSLHTPAIQEFYGKLYDWVKVTERQHPPSEKGNADVRDALLEVLDSYAAAAAPLTFDL